MAASHSPPRPTGSSCACSHPSGYDQNPSSSGKPTALTSPRPRTDFSPTSTNSPFLGTKTEKCLSSKSRKTTLFFRKALKFVHCKHWFCKRTFSFRKLSKGLCSALLVITPFPSFHILYSTPCYLTQICRVPPKTVLYLGYKEAQIKFWLFKEHRINVTHSLP